MREKAGWDHDMVGGIAHVMCVGAHSGQVIQLWLGTCPWFSLVFLHSRIYGDRLQPYTTFTFMVHPHPRCTALLERVTLQNISSDFTSLHTASNNYFLKREIHSRWASRSLLSGNIKIPELLFQRTFFLTHYFFLSAL